MFIAILSININAMKFEDITVTFQPINPNRPIITTTEVKHPIKGITTHFIFLKINQSVKIMKIKTPIPKIIMSFFIATSHASVDEIKDFREQEAQCLAKNMYFEARNQGLAGQLAVSLVVMNRVNDDRFPVPGPTSSIVLPLISVK